MALISICIPTYEMSGRGVGYLTHSFNILSKQSFKDFDVVVSDHSQNDDIKKLCEDYSNRLDLHYYRNTEGRGSNSININNAIKNATGETIKILFQDDFLVDDDSLHWLYIHFFGNTNQWLVSACCHTKDGINLNNEFYPKYHDSIQYGTNTISSPSVLMFKNEKVEYFDENTIWLMDVEYYKRMYDKFGLPSVCNFVTVANREHETQLSKTLPEETKTLELNYIRKKYETK